MGRGRGDHGGPPPGGNSGGLVPTPMGMVPAHMAMQMGMNNPMAMQGMFSGGMGGMDPMMMNMGGMDPMMVNPNQNRPLTSLQFGICVLLNPCVLLGARLVHYLVAPPLQSPSCGKHFPWSCHGRWRQLGSDAGYEPDDGSQDADDGGRAWYGHEWHGGPWERSGATPQATAAA